MSKGKIQCTLPATKTAKEKNYVFTFNSFIGLCKLLWRSNKNGYNRIIIFLDKKN